MDHGPYLHIVPGSQSAVLMIHGIAGTPAHFRDLLPVIPEDWSVYNILLEGHSGSVEDFGASSMAKWKAQVAAQLARILDSHENIYLVGHSMGTLFAIQAALEYPDRIRGLFLLAVPLRPWVRFSTVLTCLRVAWGDPRPEDHAAWAMRNDTGICLTRKLWKYASWAPRMLELLGECGRTRRALPGLRVPALAFQSRTDELVSMRTMKHLEKHPGIRVTVLEDSGHFAYGPGDLRLLQTEFADFLK